MKCTITGKFHGYGDECDAFATAEITKPLWGVACLICGESVRISEQPIYGQEVCYKCKAAILKMRENLERDPTEPILD